MAGTRSALVISASKSLGGRVPDLPSVDRDVADLDEVLSDPAIGNYHVSMAHNQKKKETLRQLYKFFENASREDDLLLYLAGQARQGVKSGFDFMLGPVDAADSRRSEVTISDQEIRSAMINCRARKVAIVADLCVISDALEGFNDQFNLAMTRVRKSNLGLFFVFAVVPSVSAYSVPELGSFTSSVVRGLRTGLADRDEDGLIHLDELPGFVERDTQQFVRHMLRSGGPPDETFLLAAAPNSSWSVSTRGYGDRPPEADLLNRGAILDALTDLIAAGAAGVEEDRDGPTVIALDGAWGIGKTSLITLTERRLAQMPQSTVAATAPRPLRACDADRALSGRGKKLWAPDMIERAGTATRASIITSKFEPWAHQTGEQVWAGLARSLLGAVTDRLLPPGSAAAERYWFQRNVDRIDRMRLRRSLRKNVLSPLLTISAFALLAPIVAQLVRSFDNYKAVWWVDVVGHTLAVYLVAAMFVVGVVHSVVRYRRPAANFLPAELFVGPIVSAAFAREGRGGDEAVRDPYYNARSGYLYLLQHDVFAVLEDVKNAGHNVVVFIDDLDRCSPGTTAEVFEAINLFVNRTFPVTRFVLCLDTSAVARHLDQVYAPLRDIALDNGDPSPGWSFLRKLIQLPIPLPPVSQTTITNVLASLLRPAAMPSPDVAITEEATRLPEAQPQPAPEMPTPDAPPPAREVGEVVHVLEHDRLVYARMADRLSAQPNPSVRETKRILTTWQYLVRVLIRLRGVSRAPLIEDARDLVVLAEIVTRWPAAQRGLHRRVGGQHGIGVLARAVGDDWEWTLALRTLGLDGDRHRSCADGLRDLLRNYDGERLAALASELV